MTHPNVQRAHDYLAAYGRGDLDAVGELLHDDIVWRVAGTHRFSGTYRGKEAVLDYFRSVTAETDSTLDLEPIEVMASDRHGSIVLRVTGEREGRELDTVMAEAFTVGPDGRWTEFWAMANDQSAIDGFWS